MPRLQDPDSKVIVSVDDAYGAELKALGWKAPEAPAKTPRKSPTDK